MVAAFAQCKDGIIVVAAAAVLVFCGLFSWLMHVMPMTHSQESYRRILFKSTCTRSLHVCRRFFFKTLTGTWPELGLLIGRFCVF